MKAWPSAPLAVAMTDGTSLLLTTVRTMLTISV
jgi:hypothetical protein